MSSVAPADAEEAEAAAAVPPTLPGQMPLLCKSMTLEQWEAYQHERAIRPPRQPLAFQYPAGQILWQKLSFEAHQVHLNT